MSNLDDLALIGVIVLVFGVAGIVGGIAYNIVLWWTDNTFYSYLGALIVGIISMFIVVDKLD